MELYLCVFLARYIDLLPFFSRHRSHHDWSLETYLVLMKLMYIGVAATVVYVIRFKEPFKTTYDSARDDFPHWQYLAAPAAVVALFLHYGWSSGSWLSMFVEMCWAFSQYLEAVAIFPQSVLMRRDKEVANLTSQYVFSLGVYRVCYILNWIFKLATRDNYSDWISWTAGSIQTLIFADFFYYYARSKYWGLDGVALPS